MPLRFALLQTPGIQDVVFDRRAGTFTCYVYAITPVAAASTLQLVQDTLDQTVAFPITGVASNPDLVGITLATTISLVSGTTQTDLGYRSVSIKNLKICGSLATRSGVVPFTCATRSPKKAKRICLTVNYLKC
jgi:hypothetical protein